MMNMVIPHDFGFYNATLQWRHNEHDGVSNHQPHDCWLNRLVRRRSKKTSKLRVTGLCEGNSPVTREFPTQRASNAGNVSIWWRHHVEKRPYNTTSRAFPTSPLLSSVDEIRLEYPTFISDSGSGHVLRVTNTIPHTIILITVKMRQMRVGSKVIIQLQKVPASKIKH